MSSNFREIQTFNFDFDNAKQTLALLKNPKMSDADKKAFVKLPGTQAVIKKIKANDTLAMQAIADAANGGSDKKLANFQYAWIKQNSKELEAFLNVIIEKQDSIKDVLRTTFSPYLEKNKDYIFNVYFLMGSYSMGFTFGEGNTFYMGLHFYKNDMQCIVLTCKHELFHNIQSLYYDAYKTTKKLGKIGAGYAVVHSLLNNLFKEGTASYIEEYPLLKNKKTPKVKELREHNNVNNYRIGGLNLLINRQLIDVFNHPNAENYDVLYELLFDWNWNNPAYFAGENMMQALADAKGKAELFDYLKKDAVYFVLDYIALSKTDKEKYPIQFSEEFEAMVNEIKAQIELINKQ
jgi:hypothetical protein